MIITKYYSEYIDNVNKAAGEIGCVALERAYMLIRKTVASGRKIYVMGNGGSAAIADHFATDFLKGCQSQSEVMPQVISLNSNMSMITAIANDLGYDRVFSHQLKSVLHPLDLVIVISSSGNSLNILNALDVAEGIGAQSIAIVGFDGGKALKMATVGIHVRFNGYGVSEDVSQMVMHALAHSLRKEYLYEPEGSEGFVPF